MSRALTTTRPPSLDVKKLIESAASIAQSSADPRFAARAYANAASRIRVEAVRNTRDRLALQQLAAQCDTLAAQALQPTVDWESGEPINLFASNPRAPDAYDGMVDDVARSKVDDNGNPVSELAAAARLQQIIDAREAETCPPVQINPESAKAGLTLFGSEALVQYGGSGSGGSFLARGGALSGAVPSRTEAPVVRWDGREQDTRTVTIAVSRVPSATGATFPTAANPSSVNYNYRPYFKLQFGTSRGAPCEVIGDVARGVQFSFASAFAYLNVGMDAPPTAAIAPANPPTAGSMWLAGTLGFFATNRPTPITRTLYADALSVGGSVTFVIPAFATTIEAIYAPAAANMTFTVQDAAGTSLYTVTASQLRSNGVVLDGEAYQIVIANGVATQASARVVFGLSL